MKLNKQILKQIILEELNEMDTPLGKDRLSTADVRSDAVGSAKAQGAQGITSQERGLIKKLNDLLINAAEDTNLASGVVFTRIKQLADELAKQEEQPGEQQ